MTENTDFDEPGDSKHISSSCPDCGPVLLDCDEVNLQIFTNANSANYSFDCDGCGFIIVHHADGAMVNRLVMLGAEVFRMKLAVLPITEKECRSFRKWKGLLPADLTGEGETD